MNIWIPKVKILEPNCMFASAPTGVAGYFRMEVANRYGTVDKRRTLEWKQLITNLGMAALGSSTEFSDGVASANGSFCAVGTGSPTFTNTSTGLASSLGVYTNTLYANSATRSSSSPYVSRWSRTFEFALGALVGNLTEVGIMGSSNNTTGRFLDLIRDSGGTPTTFPVTVNDQLRVTHIIDLYPALGSNSGSFTIGGAAGSGSHDYETSHSSMATTNQSSNVLLTMWGNSGWWRGVSALGAITAQLTGTEFYTGQNWTSATTSSTSDNVTWTRTASVTLGLTQANHTDGITGWGHSSIYGGRKFRITPAIPKFAGSVQRILTLNASTSITRV